MSLVILRQSLTLPRSCRERFHNVFWGPRFAGAGRRGRGPSRLARRWKRECSQEAVAFVWFLLGGELEGWVEEGGVECRKDKSVELTRGIYLRHAFTSFKSDQIGEPDGNCNALPDLSCTASGRVVSYSGTEQCPDAGGKRHCERPPKSDTNSAS